MPNLKIGEIHLTLLALFRPANRTSPACSIQFSFFLSAWFLFERSAFPQRNLLLSQPSHTVKDRDTRGQKSRSDYQIRASLPVSDKVAINWRVSHVPGASPRRGKTTHFQKNVNDFSLLFWSFFAKRPGTIGKSMVFHENKFSERMAWS